MTRWHHPRDDHEFAAREAEMEVRGEAIERAKEARLEWIEERTHESDVIVTSSS